MIAATGQLAPFPWDEVMSVAFGMLRLSPDIFWKMSPIELAAALAMFGGSATNSFKRSDLEELMQQFPDKISRGKNGR